MHASKILPVARIPDDQRETALDLIYDRRREGYDPLGHFLDLFEGVDAQDAKATRAQELAALPLSERLERRVIDGERVGLEADLDEALQTRPALEIVNDTLLDGMKVVGELFGRGEMQLPFVLQSAEIMKLAVAYLEPHMEKTDDAGKGTIVLATVKGDVHDIGKNLVDIILSNNGYSVVNLGIKQPVSAIIEAAEENEADAIGMSGLLVKSTVIMKENLEEITHPRPRRALAGTARWCRADPRLRRAGSGRTVRRRRALRPRRIRGPAVDGRRDGREARRRRRGVAAAAAAAGDRSGRTTRACSRGRRRRGRTSRPTCRFRRRRFGATALVKGIPLADYADLLDEKATFAGRWGLRGVRGGPSYDDLVETEGRPRMRKWLDRMQTEGWLDAGVVYGYYPCVSEGNDVVVLNDDGSDGCDSPFRASAAIGGCVLADFFRPRESGETDVIAFQVVTIGSKVSEATAELFAENAYRDYLELHGLSVQLAEALAEFWHRRIRDELGVGADDSADVRAVLEHQAYRGSRYSFGYPACPDLEDRAKIVELLRPERIGVTLSEELQLHPEQSTDALVLHHPEAKYFSA